MEISLIRRFAVPVVVLAVLAYAVSTAWAGHPVNATTVAQLVLFALPVAGLYAISATGLVVVYSATGIFNLAQGAIGMFCAFVYWELSVNQGIPVPVALVLVIFVFAPIVGVLLNRTMMQRLKRSPLITQMIGTVGIMAVLVGVAVLIWNPNDSYPMPGLGGEGGIRISGVLLSWHRVITIGTAILLAIVLRFILSSTRLGVSMRAVVDDEDLSSLHGIRPQRVSDAAWIIGSVCAAMAGILIAPEVGNMSADTLTFFVINCFAAAVFGRLKSLPMTYAGAMLLGLIVSFTSTFVELQGRWLPLTDVLPAVALFAVLLLLPQASIRMGQPVRHYPVERVATLRSVLTGSSVLIVLAVVASQTVGAVNISRLTAAVMVGIVLLGMVPLLGWAGLPFFAPYALAGIGAWVTWEFGGSVQALLAAGVVSAAAGVLIALPVLRLRELYLALSSIAFALIAVKFLFVQPEVFQVPRTLDRLDFLGIDVSVPGRFLVYSCVIYALLAIALITVRRSRFGRRTVAMRDSEAATACVGINAAVTKAMVFALAGAVSGIGGGVIAQGQRFVSADQFPMIAGLGIILSLTVMGVGTTSGPLIAGLLGAVLVALSKDWAPGDITHALELFGPALAVLALSGHPRGQIPVITENARRNPWGSVVSLSSLIAGIVVCYLAKIPGEIGLVLVIAGFATARMMYGLYRRPSLDEPVPPDDRDWRLGVTIPVTAAHVRAWDRELGIPADSQRQEVSA